MASVHAISHEILNEIALDDCPMSQHDIVLIYNCMCSLSESSLKDEMYVLHNNVHITSVA